MYIFIQSHSINHFSYLSKSIFRYISSVFSAILKVPRRTELFSNHVQKTSISSTRPILFFPSFPALIPFFVVYVYEGRFLPVFLKKIFVYKSSNSRYQKHIAYLFEIPLFHFNTNFYWKGNLFSYSRFFRFRRLFFLSNSESNSEESVENRR